MASTTETYVGSANRNILHTTKSREASSLGHGHRTGDSAADGTPFHIIQQELSIPNAATKIPTNVTKLRTSAIVFQLSAINFLASFQSGVIVVGLPRIATSIDLPPALYLWPSSVYGLTSGATLLIFASIADFYGPRHINLVGELFVGLSSLACGLATTGVQMVIFRAFLGIAMSLHLPSSVSIVTKFIPSGKSRNIGFSCLGLSQPLGFSFGLVIGGILVDTIGWRVGFYIPGAWGIAMAIMGCWVLPKDRQVQRPSLKRLWTDVDWTGAFIMSASLTMFSYVLAILSTDSANIQLPSSIALLVVSIALMPAFPAWIRRQERLGKPALISNSLWKKLPFTSICLMVLLSWGATNAMELFSSLYFQEVQNLSALQASLRLLPNLLLGAFINLIIGLLVDRFSAFWLVVITNLCTAGAPLLMAVIHPEWSYWTGAFFAQILGPLSIECLFTVGLLVVSNIFPENTQALAGGVFNMVAQFGITLGLSVMQVISMLVTKDYGDKHSPEAVLQGYRASFWAMFGFMLLCVLLGSVGLRKVGKVGLKRE